MTEGFTHLVLDAELPDAGQRADIWLTENMEDMTRSRLQRLFQEGLIRLENGAVLQKNYRLNGGESIHVLIPQPRDLDVKAQEIPLEILFEDADLLVVNKPKGMVVHPAPGNPDGTLVNALLHHCRGSLSGINGVLRPGIVHRIDKDTSGLLMVAKNDAAHLSLSAQIKAHSFRREYACIVYGNVKEEGGTVDAPIARHRLERKKMAVSSDKSARKAVSHYSVVQRLDGFTWLKVALQTGRTHQIRVHMAYLGHPVAGDAVYGPKKVITELRGQCLHAQTLGFVHPRTGETLAFTSALPDFFTAFARKHGADASLF